jgi:mono/diheme cytochrome c family protein
MIRTVLSAALAVILASCAVPIEELAPSPESIANDGRDIAEAQCAACHAVGAYGESPNPAAPHFRTILSRYRADVLEDELIAGIRVSHPMPDFQFNPQGAGALIEYMRSIQETPTQERRSEALPGSGSAEEGRRIAEMNCATCHAIGGTGESRHPMAPPFRNLSQGYPLNSLEEAFAEGILVGHPDMPEFELEPAQIDHLIAYLNSIQLRQGG